MPPQQTDLSCPNCHQIDQVQKVSAVVDAGSVDGNFTFRVPGSTFRGQATGASRTSLSIRLAPPVKPRLVESYQFKSLFYLIVVIGALIFYLVAHGEYANSTASAIYIILGSAVAAVLIGFIVRDFYQGIMAERNNYAKAVKEWSLKLENWNKLYYCARCDGVFIPQKTQLIPSTQMDYALAT